MLKLLEGRNGRTRKKGWDKDRHARVARAAYLLAEKRGFAPGGELDDWLRAEQMIDAGAEVRAWD